MTDLELIFSMLGEASTTAITKADNAQGFPESRRAAIKGGSVAGKARKDLERKPASALSLPRTIWLSRKAASAWRTKTMAEPKHVGMNRTPWWWNVTTM